jgi:hypothetical protein
MKSVPSLALGGVLFLVLGSSLGIVWAAPVKADFVFIVDASSSMADKITAVKQGLEKFLTGLQVAQVDARFALVLFGNAPELVLDFTNDREATKTAFNKINVKGAVSGFQKDHSGVEAGLEAIRIVLGKATENTLQRDNVGGVGGLVFRDYTRTHLILITDEDSDRPFYDRNRLSGQTSEEPPQSIRSTVWQTEVHNTAQAIIDSKAFITLIINPDDTPSKFQYGDPSQDVLNADGRTFNPSATLQRLQTAGFGESLAALVLAVDLIGRVLDIRDFGRNPTVVDNFFTAKIAEAKANPVKAKDWLEALMDTTTLLATYGLLAFLVERLTNGVALVLGYWNWWRMRMEVVSGIDPSTQARIDRNRRVGLFALSALLAVTGSLLLKLNLLDQAGLKLVQGTAGFITTGFLIAAGAEPLREILKLGDRESKSPPQPTSIQLTGTLVVQQPSETLTNKGEAGK